jgi:hypothetical protein
MARSGAHHRTAVSIADAVGVSAPDAGRTDAAPSMTNPPPPLNLRPVVSSTYQRVRRVVSQSVHRLVPERTPASSTVSKHAAAATLGKPTPALRAPSGCWSLDRDEKLLTLHVYRGMTLGDLALHFDTTADQLRRANPKLHGSTLLAGQTYAIPIDHLQVVRHVVQHGETMGGLGRMVDAPTSYSIRAWNCLDSTEVRTGDTLLLFRHPQVVTTAASGR